jgi:capsular exopolysaccharide synthesis family protein
MDELALRDYLHVVRRGKWIIAQALLIVPLAAFAFSLNQTPRHQASAQVLLSQQDIGSQLTGTQSYNNDPADRQTQTQANLARVPAVAQRAINATHVRLTADQFLADSSVSTTLNSDILTFSFVARDQARAELLATAYARAYVRYRLIMDTAPITTALGEVQNQIMQLSPKSPLYNTLEDKATQLRTLAALKSANASVVRDASSTVQTAPKTVRNIVLGAVLGLFLGIALAFLREAFDTRVRSADAIEEALDLPMLARLSAPSKRMRTDRRLAMLADPGSPQSEAFRMLRTNLELALLGKESGLVMVTSATEQEGKSTTISNLAVALARAGQHVVLVDLDLRQPAIDRFFDIDSSCGITQVLTGSADLGQAVIRIPLGSYGVGGCLDVLPAGPPPSDPGELITSARLSEILEHLRGNCDLVLIDVPPLFQVGDGLVLSSKTDAVVVVTRMDVVRRPMLAELRRLLDAMPVHKLGFVVTGAELEENHAYMYGGSPDAKPRRQPQRAGA